MEYIESAPLCIIMNYTFGYNAKFIDKLQEEIKNRNYKIIHKEVLSYRGYNYTIGNGKLHSFNEAPAMITSSGERRYYNMGVLHRENDMPAIIGPRGTRVYFNNGVIHRDGDLPAIIYPDDSMAYYKNGVLHRDNGPAVIHKSGMYEYYKNGKIDRYGVVSSDR